MSISPLLEIASSYCLSPRLRTAPTVAHEEHDYSMNLRVAKWRPMPWCMAVFLNCRRCPLMGQIRTRAPQQPVRLPNQLVGKRERLGGSSDALRLCRLRLMISSNLPRLTH